MKTVLKAAIAFSTLALAAGGALAQTSTTDKSGSGSTASPAAPATPTTPSTPSTPRSSDGARPGGIAQNNPGVNPKEGPSPNPKVGSGTDRTATGPATRDTRGGGKVTFGALDANNDGKVSKTEADAQPDLAGAFSKLDKNKDGMLDQAEYKAHKSK